MDQRRYSQIPESEATELLDLFDETRNYVQMDSHQTEQQDLLPLSDNALDEGWEHLNNQLQISHPDLDSEQILDAKAEDPLSARVRLSNEKAWLHGKGKVKAKEFQRRSIWATKSQNGPGMPLGYYCADASEKMQPNLQLSTMQSHRMEVEGYPMELPPLRPFWNQLTMGLHAQTADSSCPAPFERARHHPLFPRHNRAMQEARNWTNMDPSASKSGTRIQGRTPAVSAGPAAIHKRRKRIRRGGQDRRGKEHIGYHEELVGESIQDRQCEAPILASATIAAPSRTSQLAGSTDLVRIEPNAIPQGWALNIRVGPRDRSGLTNLELETGGKTWLWHADVDQVDTRYVGEQGQSVERVLAIVLAKWRLRQD